MTAQDAWEFLQKGGVLAVMVLFSWALLNGNIIAKREYDAVVKERDELKAANKLATDELIKQSSTNAKLVESLFNERQEAASIRRSTPRRSETGDEQ